MIEEFITITGVGNICLEGYLNRQETGKAVVLTHPHPLYGGNMDVPVICRMAACFQSAGIATLRFNFRGTGGSAGKFDDGRGEQDDVRSGLDFLSDQGYDQLFLAGYSFGSWVNAHVVSAGVDICDHIMVSPPAALLSFDQVEPLPNTGLIITGENDDLAPVFLVQDLLSKWKISPRIEVLSDVDHFYVGALDKLEDVLSDYLQS
ncbi:alpha/beta hydrolase [Desulfobacter hydrogenophilus]|uniref:Alpha/beta hydrolase n=1 Tax=Desulfobacter hydrogenophilus TaxID=2291 RepID=A0A328FGU5_9BACT|nr:alpha/beta hydrolase [Desulfobacter hydrogenophilus]NDY72199.1 alpha/beta hydrolase [Desulfobacter hydrogenophilus]QBH15120.1 alpha/beta hydrolase [Desulfobacter hydrogenophilus]RAM02205.1 alpha/beta hydrolase [Desulfobacter hydrogenophilus]